jgi:hypothetical protein
MTPDADALLEALNRDCFCIGTDLPRLHAWLEADLCGRGLDRPTIESHPNLFSALPVFVSRAQIDRMQAVIAAVESVVARPGYRDAVLRDAPAIARRIPRHPGVLMSYDFHLAASGPQLIEINTNAGGALLNAALARAQRACCPEVETLLCGDSPSRSLEDEIFTTFAEEWRLARGDARLTRVAIVDREPRTQYLFPEFLLFQRLFESRGIEACIVDPAELAFDGNALRHDSRPIDLVYNRLTDFYFVEPWSRTLRLAWEGDAAVITPHPHAHALYADKRNLVRLTDQHFIESLGVDPTTVEILTNGIPATVLVDAANADRLWQERRGWFFKPAHGFGSRGSYRGDKVTRKVFAAICAGGYVAQRIVPPGERTAREDGAAIALKFDLRNYVYRGRVQMVAARLYQGQTTNFRTPGGGFAPVFHPGGDEVCARLVARGEGSDDPAGAVPAGSSSER